MAGKAGQRLSDVEAAELVAYRNRGAAPPDRFDGVVFDNATGGGGAFYRWPTQEETRAADEAAKAAEAAAADEAKLSARIDHELAKRGAADVAVAPPPPAG